MKNFIAFIFIVLSLSAIAQNIPYRVIQDSCVRKVVSNGRELYALPKIGNNVIKSTDGGMSWNHFWQPHLSWYFDGKSTWIDESVGIITVDDSVVYSGANGGTLDMNYMPGEIESTKHGIIDSTYLGSFQSLLVKDSLIVYAGWSDIPQSGVSTDHGLTWLRRPFSNGNSVPNSFVVIGSTIFFDDEFQSDSLYFTKDTFKTINAISLLPFHSTWSNRTRITRQGDTLYAFRENGNVIYYSADTAKTWKLLDLGFTVRGIESIAFIGDTLIINENKSCTIVSVEEESPPLKSTITLQDDVIIITLGEDCTEARSVQICDVLGRIVLEKQIDETSGTTSKSILLYSLPPGFYVLRIQASSTKGFVFFK